MTPTRISGQMVAWGAVAAVGVGGGFYLYRHRGDASSSNADQSGYDVQIPAGDMSTMPAEMSSGSGLLSSSGSGGGGTSGDTSGGTTGGGRKPPKEPGHVPAGGKKGPLRDKGFRVGGTIGP